MLPIDVNGTTRAPGIAYQKAHFSFTGNWLSELAGLVVHHIFIHIDIPLSGNGSLIFITPLRNEIWRVYFNINVNVSYPRSKHFVSQSQEKISELSFKQYPSF